MQFELRDLLYLHGRTISATTPSINVTITSTNGTDLTTQVKTMIYREPKIVADTDLNARWDTPGLSRPQNICPIREGEAYPGRFLYSQCDHDSDVTGSLQRYLIHCLPPRVKDTSGSSSDSDSSDGRKPSKMPFATVGMCQPHEICAPGTGPGGHFDRKKVIPNPDAQVAHCVSREYYVELAQEVSERGPSGTPLEGERASMVFSKADARTPLEVSEIDWSAGRTTVPAGMQVKGACTGCVDLLSGKFEAGTEYLKTQATVLSAAGAAILWISIMSG